jgi:hypothetical protein
MNSSNISERKEMTKILDDLYECLTPDEEIVKLICEKVY